MSFGLINRRINKYTDKLRHKIPAIIVSATLLLNPPALQADEIIVNPASSNIQAVETINSSKYPDYSKIYVGEDKHEKFNRKMFNLNMKLNKFVAKPVHIIWSSIMPKFGIERIRNAYNNIEYPKRLASCIIQRDGEGVKKETMRFLTNSTLGLGGLFDPADKIFKIKPTNENMEQALCKCKMCSGSYLIMPCLHACTPRSLCGRAIEAALDPAIYLASPITSIIKFGLMVNRTSYMQPIAKMIETNFADPYDIQKKLFGIENYIRNSNYDREELILAEKELIEEGMPEAAEQLIADLGEGKKGKIDMTQSQPVQTNFSIENILSDEQIKPDIILENYKSQTPVIDSMKTALFEDKSINKSMWNELSIWNRSFAKKIKTGYISVAENKEPYKYKYILQKDKNSPLMIFYPSIGEGAGNHHSLVFAKMFYDAGYSVVMQGSHFHWEFVKSMPDGFAPGIPQKDSEYIRIVTAKILNNLKNEYNYEPKEKIIIGTSFGAVGSLFVAEKEMKENMLNIDKYIAISPPIELKYALLQLDKNGEKFNQDNTIKDKTALSAAKILQIYNLKDDKNFKLETLPFSDEEAKLITTFIMHQKLSDIIFTIEKAPKNKVSDVYSMINNMNYQDYAEKYLGLSIENNYDDASLYSISEYLANNDNYKIYEAFDDYLINKNQIQKLKNLTGKNLCCINCGAHLGFLYRKEFIERLKKDIFGA